MKCKNCGFELPDEAKLCNNCGAIQNAVQPNAPAQERPTENVGYTPEKESQPIQDAKRKSLLPLIAGLGVVAVGLIIAIVAVLVSRGNTNASQNGSTSPHLASEEYVHTAELPMDSQNGSTSPQLASEQYVRTTELPMDSQTVTTQTPIQVQVSDAEIIQLYWNLWDTLIRTAAEGDYEGFKALYYDTDESFIQSAYTEDWKAYDQYDHRNCFVAGGKDGYYWIVYSHYIVSGTHPNTRRNSSDGYSLVHYADGVLQFAYGEDSRTILGQESDRIIRQFFESVYPGFSDEMAKAQNVGYFYNNNHLFLNSDMYYSGSYDTNLLFMWQTEAGDIKAVVWYANGTNVNISPFKTTIKIDDDTLGSVIDVTISETIPIRAEHSTVHVFTIPASDVKTGTQTWTSMHASCRTSF